MRGESPVHARGRTGKYHREISTWAQKCCTRARIEIKFAFVEYDGGYPGEIGGRVRRVNVGLRLKRLDRARPRLGARLPPGLPPVRL